MQEEGFVFTWQLGMIIGGIVGMIIGWVIGFFDSNMRSSKKIKQAEDSARVAIQDAEKKIAQAEQKVASAPLNTEPILIDDSGMMRISNRNGALTLDLDGAPVDTTTMSNDQRKRLIEMLNIIRPWLEGKPTSVPAVPASPPPAQPSPAPVMSAPPRTQVTPPAAPPSQVTGPRPSVIAKEDRPAAPAGSIVSQIDSVLQTRIVGTPLEDRGVFLSQSPEGGVMVYVGLTKYMGIDDVPDPEIKAAIRAAITEWENKYTPGL